MDTDIQYLGRYLFETYIILVYVCVSIVTLDIIGN